MGMLRVAHVDMPVMAGMADKRHLMTTLIVRCAGIEILSSH
jgi:hypothetical protein